MPDDRSAPPHRYDGVDGPRVAIAHDYLTQRGGAEKVVLSMSKAFPDAPIYTLLYDPDGTYPEFADRDIRVSPLNRVSLFRKHHRVALPVLPFAAGAMFVDADVVDTEGIDLLARALVLAPAPAGR